MAVETSLDGNHTAAILAGRLTAKVSAKAQQIWPSSYSQKVRPKVETNYRKLITHYSIKIYGLCDFENFDKPENWYRAIFKQNE